MRARIILNWDCNRSCSYCCNKIDQIRDSFKPISIGELLLTHYDEYAITGGEPLTDPCWVFANCALLRRGHPDAIIHLYTNGDLLNEQIIHNLPWSEVFDGVNIGIHEYPDSNLFQNIVNLNKVVPVRLKVPEHLAGHNFPVDNIVTWRINECLDMPDEPRFYLKEKP